MTIKPKYVPTPPLLIAHAAAMIAIARTIWPENFHRRRCSPTQLLGSSDWCSELRNIGWNVGLLNSRYSSDVLYVWTMKKKSSSTGICQNVGPTITLGG